MQIQTSSHQIVPARTRGGSPTTTGATEERFPHEAYQDSLEIAGPTLSRVLSNTAQGLGEGLGYGLGIGAVFSVPASILLIQSSVNPGLGVIGGTLAAGLLGGSIGALIGALRPWQQERRAERHHQEMAKIVSSADLPLEKSATAASWRQLDTTKPLQSLNPSDLGHLDAILDDMKGRGFHSNAMFRSAPKLLAKHDLWLDNEHIDSLDELRLLDATSGGGLAILPRPQQEAVELLAGMAHRGFKIGRVSFNGLLELYKPSAMASKVYENGFHDDSRPFDPPLQVRHASGNSTVTTLKELRELDRAQGGPA